MSPEEELVRIARKLDRMVSRNNTEGALDLLKELKRVNMTLKLLQDTRIGMSVNGIRKHCTDEEVVSLAKVLVKDWKKLLESGRCLAGKAPELDNGVNGGGKSSPPSDSSPRRWTDVRMSRDSGHVKDREEEQSEQHVVRKKIANDPAGRKPELSEERMPPVEKKREKKSEPQTEDLKRPVHVEQPKKRKPWEEEEEEEQEEEKWKRTNTWRKERGYGEDRPVRAAPPDRLPYKPQRERPVDPPRPLFERRGVLDSSILYPSRYPSPPRPARPPPLIKRPVLDPKKLRKDDKDPSSVRPPRPSAPQPSPPTTKKPAVEVKKERKLPADPNAPVAPLPLHLHPPPLRKAPPDPNAPLPPLPLHLHPPPPPQRHPSLDGKKDKDRKTSSTDARQIQQKHEKKERKDSVDGKTSKKLSSETKKERKESPETKPSPIKEPCAEIKKEKRRKNSWDSRPGQIVKSHSVDFNPERRESTDSKRSSSPPVKKTAERRESLGSKSAQSVLPQRKLSTDSVERKSRVEAPRTPTTPTSPLSPGFGSPGGPLPPHLTTGDSVRDKCIEMLAAALRTDNDHKDFGTNCDSMAAEIEDHIYQEIRATDMKYKNRVRSRISNLKDPKNPGLRRNVLAGSIELSRIATMSAEEMASDELKQLRNVLTQEAIREHQMAKTGGTTTDLLQCGKCKKKNCTYNQVQTRSADEPMTTFVLCNECGNRWKFC